MDDDRINKLPKWAQNHIEKMICRIRELEGLQTRQEKTAVSFGFTLKCDEEGYLPEHTSVRFDLGVDGVIECYRRKTGNRFVLDIHGLRNGIIVQPVASNVVHITEEPR